MNLHSCIRIICICICTYIYIYISQGTKIELGQVERAWLVGLVLHCFASLSLALLYVALLYFGCLLGAQPVPAAEGVASPRRQGVGAHDVVWLVGYLGMRQN